MSSYDNDPHQNPYWQSLTGNTPKNSAGQQTGNQNSFENDPNWNPEPEYGRQLGRTAALLGLFSIGSTFFLPIVLPVIFGSIAIVLAILSKGKQTSFTRGAKHAFLLGISGLVINLALLAACVGTIYLIFHDPSVHAQANQIVESMYGYSFDDLWNQATGANTLPDFSETNPSDSDRADGSFSGSSHSSGSSESSKSIYGEVL